MDAIDRNIIKVLQQDGRLSNQELSDKVGLSPSPCLRRVRKLEQDGVITGYAAIVDQDNYGLPLSVFINIRLERHSDECIKSFEKGIGQIDEIMECYLMTGKSDYLLHVVSKDLKSYEIFVREKISTIPGIASIDSSFVFGQVKRNSAFPTL
ncbi:MAG: Lrp/AsnC family transcriptional regulator [Kordiimonadaceae bacterium]|jgi:Lrp/AsnC family transcriptional regulator, leucine-responsive regulatory protein|nr:Lrp/AsnC family transcriptional regulator [Kordiimonadaceae bacterium]MBT6037591.1 Lrp/AsnC family transcriptional regulator [Kordiimonadaceae bacterium]MBT6330616.1 Lrp/AsnC family transcriptional regulator [Kordiimonadaceae bacterium]MBT7582324.1 Lrp/AsnC family transcriptional regulator [Kordiimonadaceae bacterium]